MEIVDAIRNNFTIYDPTVTHPIELPYVAVYPTGIPDSLRDANSWEVVLYHASGIDKTRVELITLAEELYDLIREIDGVFQLDASRGLERAVIPNSKVDGLASVIRFNK